MLERTKKYQIFKTVLLSMLGLILCGQTAFAADIADPSIINPSYTKNVKKMPVLDQESDQTKHSRLQNLIAHKQMIVRFNLSRRSKNVNVRRGHLTHSGL